MAKPTKPTATTRRKVVAKQVTVAESVLKQLENESDEDFAVRVEEAQAAATKAAEESAIAANKASDAKQASLEAHEAAKKADQAASVAEYEAQAKAKAAISEAEAKAKLDLVDAIVPKAFKLTLDDHTHVNYEAGTQPMPRTHVEHWFAKAHGVTLYKGANAK